MLWNILFGGIKRHWSALVLTCEFYFHMLIPVYYLYHILLWLQFTIFTKSYYDCSLLSVPHLTMTAVYYLYHILPWLQFTIFTTSYHDFSLLSVPHLTMTSKPRYHMYTIQLHFNRILPHNKQLLAFTNIKMDCKLKYFCLELLCDMNAKKKLQTI